MHADSGRDINLYTIAQYGRINFLDELLKFGYRYDQVFAEYAMRQGYVNVVAWLRWNFGQLGYPNTRLGGPRQK